MPRTVSDVIRDLHALVRKLEQMHPGRRFTLDGHLVGSIGEVVAAERYGLELLPTGSEGHDARDPETLELVQIKATQIKSIGLFSEPERLIVLSIQPDGGIHEVYSGPGAEPWRQAGKMQKNGQRRISLARLRAIADASGAHG